MATALAVMLAVIALAIAVFGLCLWFMMHAKRP